MSEQNVVNPPSANKYDDYLESDAWQAKRADAITRAGGRCQLCGKRRRLTVHHNTYVRLGNELPEDLIALCWPCHRSHHEKHPSSSDLMDNLTRNGRRLIRRLNLDTQSVTLTASERQRRAKSALKFLMRKR